MIRCFYHKAENILVIFGVVATLRSFTPLVLRTMVITDTFDDSFALCYGQDESQNITTVYRPVFMANRNYRTH